MQALLPEALVPLTLLRHEPGCRVLLCGDPKWAPCSCLPSLLAPTASVLCTIYSGLLCRPPTGAVIRFDSPQMWSYLGLCTRVHCQGTLQRLRVMNLSVNAETYHPGSWDLWCVPLRPPEPEGPATASPSLCWSGSYTATRLRRPS